MNLLDVVTQIEKEEQQEKAISYYEEQIEEVLDIFWALTDNPYRKGTEMTEGEITRMKKFLHEFKYQKGGNYV